MFPRMQNRSHSEQVMDKIHHVTLGSGESYTMKPYDHVVMVENSAGEAIVYLPNVAEAAGMIYLIYQTDATGTSVDVKAQGDAAYTETDICAVADDANTVIDVDTGAELAAVGEYVLMFSTGISWHILASHAIALTT